MKKPPLQFRMLDENEPGAPHVLALAAEDVGTLQRFIRNVPDLKGAKGDKGDDGESVKGEPGRRGRRGERGLAPDHFVTQVPDGYVLRFANAVEGEGDPIHIKHGLRGDRGAIGPRPRYEVTETPDGKGQRFRFQMEGGDFGPWHEVRQGEPGPRGVPGPRPRHEWRGTRLRFENPDGSFGEFVELRGPTGAGGGGGRGRSANPGYSSIALNGTNLEFTRAKAGPLGPDQIVDLSSISGGGGNFLEFVAQSANPGSVPANTLWMDDGSNFTVNTVVMGDLTVPMLLTGNVGFGNPGTEQGGINVNGVVYDADVKINSIGGAIDASLILHRHSTAFPPNLTFARSNSDTAAHAAVALGQTLGWHVFTGWTGTHYDIGAVIDARVSPAGTVSPTSLPTEIAISTTPNGSNVSLAALIIGSDQVLYGDVQSQGELTLRGTQNPDLGFIRMSSPVQFDGYTANPLAAYGFNYGATEVFTGPFVGGGLNFSGSITFQNSVMIYESFRGAPTITSAANPGFAAYTVLQALPLLIAGSGGGMNPLQALVVNAGATVRNPFAGTRTVAAVAGMNFASQLQTTVAGATLNATNWTGITIAPTWSTVAGSIINFGTIRGVWARNPLQSSFGTSAGTERLNAYFGLDVENITLNSQFGSATRAAVRSAMTPGNNKFFLLSTGGAPSDFGSGDITTSGVMKVNSYSSGQQFGVSSEMIVRYEQVVANTPGDVWTWQFAGNSKLYWKAWLGVGGEYWTLGHDQGDQSAGNGLGFQLAFDTIAFSKVLQADPDTSNFYVAFAGPPDRTPSVNGGYADVLWTSGGDLDMNGLTMSDVSAFQINTPSIVLSGGTIVEVANLYLAGMPTSVTVSGDRSALRVTGRAKVSGTLQYPPIAPAALGAGDNNNWAGLLTATASNSSRYWARVSGNATTSVITGIDATTVQDGDTFEITNVSGNTILFADQNTGSVAANRIITGVVGSYAIAEDETVTIRYDATTARWRITTPAGAVLPMSSAWKFDNTVTMADPGSTFFRLNNATLASVTAIALSDITFKEGDASAILAALGAGDQMYIQNEKDAAQRMVFDITSVVDNTTWFQINGTVNVSGSAFTDNKEFSVVAIFA